MQCDGRASWQWQTATGVFATEPVTAGRVWTNVTSAQTQRVNAATPVRNPTVLKRLLRRLSG